MFGWYIAIAIALLEALSGTRGDLFLKNLVASHRTEVLMTSANRKHLIRVMHLIMAII